MAEDDLYDSVQDYADARFEIRPHPTLRDLLRINDFVNELGYEFPYSSKQYSLEDVQEKLRAEGPQAFLRYVRLQEDLSPRAPFKAAAAFVAERLARLGPARDLIIIDPYLFPERPQLGARQHGEFLAEIIAPILEPGAVVRCVVNPKMNSEICDAATVRLNALISGATLDVTRADDFHDRFWIADRARGVVVGASFNGLGRKIFLMDDLKKSDLASILEATAQLGL